MGLFQQCSQPKPQTFPNGSATLSSVKEVCKNAIASYIRFSIKRWDVSSDWGGDMSGWLDAVLNTNNRRHIKSHVHTDTHEHTNAISNFCKHCWLGAWAQFDLCHRLSIHAWHLIWRMCGAPHPARCYLGTYTSGLNRRAKESAYTNKNNQDF